MTCLYWFIFTLKANQKIYTGSKPQNLQKTKQLCYLEEKKYSALVLEKPFWSEIRLKKETSSLEDHLYYEMKQFCLLCMEDL